MVWSPILSTLSNSSKTDNFFKTKELKISDLNNI